MVVDHSGGLHDGIADGGPHKAKASALEVLTHGVGLFGESGDFGFGPPGVLDSLPTREPPDIAVKTAIFRLDRKKRAGIADSSFNLEPVANNAWIGEQLINFARIIRSNFAWIKGIERLTVVGTLSQYGQPAQAGLSSFQHEKFEEPAIIMQRHTPLAIMVSEVKGIGCGPDTSRLIGRFHMMGVLVERQSGLLTTAGRGIFSSANKIPGLFRRFRWEKTRFRPSDP
jgi:hypothetical protein